MVICYDRVSRWERKECGVDLPVDEELVKSVWLHCVVNEWWTSREDRRVPLQRMGTVEDGPPKEGIVATVRSCSHAQLLRAVH